MPIDASSATIYLWRYEDGFTMKELLLYIRYGLTCVLYRVNKKKTLQYALELALIAEQLGWVFRAARSYYRIIKEYPEDARGYYGIAILNDNRKQYHKANDWYKKALEVNPKFIPAWFFLAGAAHETGDKQMAIECYQKVIDLDPQISGPIITQVPSVKNWTGIPKPFSISEKPWKSSRGSIKRCSISALFFQKWVMSRRHRNIIGSPSVDTTGTPTAF